MNDSAQIAARVISLSSKSGETLATAESLTGGMLGETLTSVPGASAVFRGGVIAYATELKATLLSVDAQLLRDRGPVDATVAGAMARGASSLCDADIGLATTGVAGPDGQAGHSPGTVFVAMFDRRSEEERVLELHLSGSRDEIRRASVIACLQLLLPAAG